MTTLQSISSCTMLRIVSGAAVTVALLASPVRLHSQQTSIDDSQAGVLTNLDQSTLYPIQTQMAQTSNQNHLNENADTARYTDNALRQRPFYFSLETLGVWTSNLANTYDTVPARSGEYLRLGAPVGVHFWNSRSDFNAFLRVDTSLYPGNSYLNHTSEVYSHQYLRKLSEITTASWSLAGGHVVTLGQYLSPLIGVGSTGVVSPQQTGGLQATNDAATTFTLAHQLSERDTISASGTAGWLDQPLLAVKNAQIIGAYRQVTGGGVLQWQHALNSREIAGVELNNVYVKGLNPDGDSNFSSAKLTFSQTLTPHTFFTGGIGPLFIHSVFPGVPNQDEISYAANAAVDYNQRIGHISVGYARVYAVGYLSPSSLANQLYASFDRPVSSRLHLTADTQYIRTTLPVQQQAGAYSQVGFTTRLDMYLTPTLIYQIGGSVFNQDATPEIPGYHYNTFSTGITYAFGHRLNAAEVQP
jgi:hypothetical protein